MNSGEKRQEALDQILEAQETELLQFLGFTVDGGEFGIDVSRVIEIITAQTMTRLPNIPPVVRGVINLRGKVIPIIDLGVQFNRRSLQEASCIVVTHLEREGSEISLGLLVDDVLEVFRVSPQQLERPDLSDRDGAADFIHRMARLEDQVLLLLDLEGMTRRVEQDMQTESW